MKKYIIFISALSISLQAFSSYIINWNRGNVFASSENTTPGDPELINNDSLYALYFTSNEVDKLFPVSSFAQSSEVWSMSLTDVGNNRLVAAAVDFTGFESRGLSITTDQSGAALPQNSGFFYTMIFNFDASGLGIIESDATTWDVSIPNPTFAFISDVTEVNWSSNPATPGTSVSVNKGGQYFGGEITNGLDIPEGSSMTTTQMIPEPGTLVLVLVAALGAVLTLRRRRS